MNSSCTLHLNLSNSLFPDHCKAATDDELSNRSRQLTEDRSTPLLISTKFWFRPSKKSQTNLTKSWNGKKKGSPINIFGKPGYLRISPSQPDSNKGKPDIRRRFRVRVHRSKLDVSNANLQDETEAKDSKMKRNSSRPVDSAEIINSRKKEILLKFMKYAQGGDKLKAEEIVQLKSALNNLFAKMASIPVVVGEEDSYVAKMNKLMNSLEAGLKRLVASQSEKKEEQTDSKDEKKVTFASTESEGDQISDWMAQVTNISELHSSDTFNDYSGTHEEATWSKSESEREVPVRLTSCNSESALAKEPTRSLKACFSEPSSSGFMFNTTEVKSGEKEDSVTYSYLPEQDLEFDLDDKQDHESYDSGVARSENSYWFGHNETLAYGAYETVAKETSFIGTLKFLLQMREEIYPIELMVLDTSYDIMDIHCLEPLRILSFGPSMRILQETVNQIASLLEKVPHLGEAKIVLSEKEVQVIDEPMRNEQVPSDTYALQKLQKAIHHSEHLRHILFSVLKAVKTNSMQNEVSYSIKDVSDHLDELMQSKQASLDLGLDTEAGPSSAPDDSSRPKQDISESVPKGKVKQKKEKKSKKSFLRMVRRSKSRERIEQELKEELKSLYRDLPTSSKLSKQSIDTSEDKSKNSGDFPEACPVFITEATTAQKSRDHIEELREVLRKRERRPEDHSDTLSSSFFSESEETPNIYPEWNRTTDMEGGTKKSKENTHAQIALSHEICADVSDKEVMRKLKLKKKSLCTVS